MRCASAKGAVKKELGKEWAIGFHRHCGEAPQAGESPGAATKFNMLK